MISRSILGNRHIYCLFNTFILTGFIFLSYSTQSFSQCTHPDYEAMMALYNSTDGPNWRNNDGWAEGAAGTNCDPCTWRGVSCSDGVRVSFINLRNNNLSGPIPEEIGDLTFLTFLNVQDNGLIGGTIPRTISGLLELGSLFMTGCNLSGTIPDLPSTMRRLGLSNNNLTGGIPFSPALVLMDLWDNQLSGPIPDNFYDMTDLLEVSINSNNITGSISPRIGQLQNLEKLWLEVNNLTGEIPPELGSLPRLKDLNLNLNQLTVTIPIEITSSTSLENFQVQVNQLTGTIPPEFGSMPNLTLLGLNGNQFTGNIPNEIANLDLTFFVFGYNNFSGCIPVEFEKFCGIDRFVMKENPLLPWSGSEEDFCNNVNNQIGAPCDTIGNKVILEDCSCGFGDLDNDGYTSDVDCDDNDANINPGAIEACDDIDNDCDGLVDEDFPDHTAPAPACLDAPPGEISVDWEGNPTVDLYYIYLDGAFHGSTEAAPYTITGLLTDQAYDIRVEALFAGDCSNLSDMLSCRTSAFSDNDNDGFTSDIDCDDNDASIYPGAVEICDDRDNNCDGQVDEGFEGHVAPAPVCLEAGPNFLTIEWDAINNISTFFIYVDGNYLESTQNSAYTLTGLNPQQDYLIRVEAVFNNGCENLRTEITCSTSGYADNDGDGYNEIEDCNDNDASINPGAMESCDEIDNNCDGIIDEGFEGHVAPAPTCLEVGSDFITISWDGINNISTFFIYVDGSYLNSTQDNSFMITGLTPQQEYTLRVEAVFNNGCSNLRTEIVCSTGSFADNDGDGSTSDEDCDDNDSTVFPGATEVCDSKDNDCNGMIDDGLTFLDYYWDEDGDGYGDDDTIFNDCIQSPGYVLQAGDCDDTNPDIFPGAEEIVNNGIDEDCDGEDQTTTTHTLEGNIVEIYPSPAIDIINVTGYNGVLSYTVLSAQGQLLETGFIDNNKINVSNWKVGAYFLMIQIEQNGDRLITKVLKM